MVSPSELIPGDGTLADDQNIAVENAAAAAIGQGVGRENFQTPYTGSDSESRHCKYRHRRGGSDPSHR